jgi:hypothetical protein
VAHREGGRSATPGSSGQWRDLNPDKGIVTERRAVHVDRQPQPAVRFSYGVVPLHHGVADRVCDEVVSRLAQRVYRHRCACRILVRPGQSPVRALTRPLATEDQHGKMISRAAATGLPRPGRRPCSPASPRSACTPSPWRSSAGAGAPGSPSGCSSPPTGWSRTTSPPQALAFLMYVGALAIVPRWLTRPASPHQTIGAAVAVVLLVCVPAPTHQVTPFALAAVLAVLAATGRRARGPPNFPAEIGTDQLTWSRFARDAGQDAGLGGCGEAR